RQAAMEITAKYCRKEMEDYGMCVASNPSSWQQDCHQLKVKVAHCTSSHPVIQKIRSDCSEPFSAFEQCLKLNQTSVGNCSEHISKFLACAETVKLASLGTKPQCLIAMHYRVTTPHEPAVPLVFPAKRSQQTWSLL
ncbi:CHCH5 protein, partial [Polyodon spathula]|nr:CHCH5 protein [Polyodon spathula]